MLGALVGFVGGFISAIAIRWWQYQRESWIDQVDCFCDAVQQACDLGADYWSKEYKETDTSEQKIDEAKILGKLIQVDGYWSLVSGRLCNKHRFISEAALAKFTNSLTGGDFSVSYRNKSLDAVRALYDSSSGLIISVKRGSIHAITIGGWLRYRWEVGQRLQDDAINGIESPS